jgi:CBS domain-containing protein
MALMHEEGVSALPLVSRGKLSGIVTESDLLRILRTLLGAVPADNEARDLDATEKGQVMLGNPLVQNLMKLLSEAGI